LTSLSWFPNAIAGSFMTALDSVFYVSVALCLIAALCSALRGNKVILEEKIGKVIIDPK